MRSRHGLAWRFPTVLPWGDAQEVVRRPVLGRGQRFFEDRRALTRYMVCERWQHLMEFMVRGLALESQRAPQLDTG